MLNIFYNPSYFKGFQKKIFLTKQLRYSILFNFIVDLLYIFNLPYPKNLIYSGPQMRMNHLIRASRKNSKIFLNKKIADNNYILQFDEFGQKKLTELINSRNSNTKIIVGPLFTLEMDKKLDTYIKKYPFIKKLVASNATLEYQKILHKYNDTSHIFVAPSGIVEKKELDFQKIVNKKYDCLVYFKKRNPDDLKFIIQYLEEKKISYNILKYGEYRNKDLKKLSQLSRFGIVIDKTETQGFAIQELLENNLPLLVWDYKLNLYEGYKLKGTSVPIWDDTCGVIFEQKKEFDNAFKYFLDNLENFSPSNFVKKNLSYEKFISGIFQLFQNENNWTT
tara:strand:+ start:1513 stop:2517 length:1005 start_codon:yes stop_codon:yes gene_type:complete